MFSYSIKVNKLKNPAGKIVAFAALLIDDVLEVHGFRVINGSKGLFVSPPQHLGKVKNEAGQLEDKYFDDVRFVGDNWQEVSDEIKAAIITAYQSTGGLTRADAANAHAQVNNAPAAAPEGMPAAPQGQSRKPLW